MFRGDFIAQNVTEAGWGEPVFRPYTILQALVDELRTVKKVDVVVLLSHNGVPVDTKLARRVSGLDVILGGHTHDGLPAPIRVNKTLIVSSGSHGKFLSRLDLDVKGGRIAVA